jgi:hypothetical protein
VEEIRMNIGQAGEELGKMGQHEKIPYSGWKISFSGTSIIFDFIA